jgi:phosphoribosylglycinamide formyltransferase-1
MQVKLWHKVYESWFHDAVNSLAQRVHTLEHIIYPQVVEWICTQTIQHTDPRVLYRDTLMHEPIQFCKF